MAGLLEARAQITLVSTAGHPGPRGDWRPRVELTWLHAALRARRPRGAWYAVAATDDPATNALVAAEAEAARIFCVRAGSRAAEPPSPRPAETMPARIGVISGTCAGHRHDPRRVRPSGTAVEASARSAGHPARMRCPAAAARRRAARGRAGRRRSGRPGVDHRARAAGGWPQADVVVADQLAPRVPARGTRCPHVEVIDASKLPRGRVDGPGADQRAARRPRAGRQAGGAAQGRGPVRLRPRRARRSRRAWPRGSRSRSSRG